MFDQAVGSFAGIFDNRPISVSVHAYEVVRTLMVEEITADALKWVLRHRWWGGWCTGLWRFHAVAFIAGASAQVYFRLYTWPEDWWFCPWCHWRDPLMSWVKSREDIFSKWWRDDDPLLTDSYSINCVQIITALEIFSQFFRVLLKVVLDSFSINSTNLLMLLSLFVAILTLSQVTAWRLSNIVAAIAFKSSSECRLRFQFVVFCVE